AEPHAVVRDLRRIDRRELAQAHAKLAEPSLHELLALQRGLVLAVLAQVAELHGFPDLLRKRDVQLVLELLDLRPELLFQFFNHASIRKATKRPTPGRGGRAQREYCNVLTGTSAGKSAICGAARPRRCPRRRRPNGSPRRIRAATHPSSPRACRTTGAASSAPGARARTMSAVAAPRCCPGSTPRRPAGDPDRSCPSSPPRRVSRPTSRPCRAAHQ